MGYFTNRQIFMIPKLPANFLKQISKDQLAIGLRVRDKYWLLTYQVLVCDGSSAGAL